MHCTLLLHRIVGTPSCRRLPPLLSSGRNATQQCWSYHTSHRDARSRHVPHAELLCPGYELLRQHRQAGIGDCVALPPAAACAAAPAVQPAPGRQLHPAADARRYSFASFSCSRHAPRAELLGARHELLRQRRQQLVDAGNGVRGKLRRRLRLLLDRAPADGDDLLAAVARCAQWPWAFNPYGTARSRRVGRSWQFVNALPTVAHAHQPAANRL